MVATGLSYHKGSTYLYNVSPAKQECSPAVAPVIAVEVEVGVGWVQLEVCLESAWAACPYPVKKHLGEVLLEQA